MIQTIKSSKSSTSRFIRIIFALCLSGYFAFGQDNGLVETDSINTRATRLKITLRFLNLKPQDSIADIGSGSGTTILRLAQSCENCFFTVEDIDSNLCSIERYSKEFKKSGVDISHFTFHIGNENSTTLPDKNYDKVLMFDVMHELSNKKGMLGDIKRILRPEGSLFIEEILVQRKVKKDKGCSYTYLKEEEFKQILKENGWAIKREDYTYKSTQNRYIKIFECAISH